MSQLIRQEQCPECAKLGKDLSKDNLAVYSDGHKFCYSCKYVEHSDGVSRFINQINELDKIEHTIDLPEDCDIIYPSEAMDWIGQYELTENDLLLNNVLWSPSFKRLIFPVYGEGRNLIAWQGRLFDGENIKPKWYGKGNLKDTFNILGQGEVRSLVLLEDIVSAIKVAKLTHCMPLYGCNIGIYRFKRIQQLYGLRFQCSIWLDPDKRTESVIEARNGNLCGLDMKVIFSDKDPKELTLVEIKELL